MAMSLQGKHNVVILDGGIGCQLIEMGHSNIYVDPLFSASLLKTNPADIITAHKQFYEVGADITMTVSYQASIDGFKKFMGIEQNEATELIKDSVRLARQTAVEEERISGRRCYVAGSVGPYGACLHDGSEYSGNYIETKSIQELSSWHLPRINALVEAGADFIGVETFPALKEAEAVLETLKLFPNTQVFINFSCKDDQHTCHGENLVDCMRKIFQSDQIIAGGINCTHPKYISSLLSSLQADDITKPIIVKPNGGEDWTTGIGWTGRNKDHHFLSEFVDEWLELGASWIGGCCRIFPADIGHLRKSLEANKSLMLKVPFCANK